MQFHLPEVCLPNSESGGATANSFELRLLGCSAGRIFFQRSKNGERSTIRSFITGKCGSGATWITSLLSDATRVWQARRGWKLIDIEHVPHMPTRHEQRNARLASCWRWMRN